MTAERLPNLQYDALNRIAEQDVYTQGPLVSIVIPCRNERSQIGVCLDSLLASDYSPGNLEILVVDGMSEDGTREIVANYAREHPSVKLVDNPSHVTPVGMNLGIERSAGDVIAIVGAHTIFDRNYISECVKYLDAYGADEVGGVLLSVPRENTVVGRAIAECFVHPFGSGADISFKRGTKEPRWVPTVFSGCFRRSVFERIGRFNEDLKQSQDSEFNHRLAAAGGRILLIPHVIVRYLCRSNLCAFMRHAWRNGVWVTLPIAYTEISPVRWVHLVPLAFASALLGSALLGIWVHSFVWIFGIVAGSYALANLAASIHLALKKRDARYCLVMPLVFAILHLGYGFGSLCGLMKAIGKPRIWRRSYHALVGLRKQVTVADRANRAG